MPSDPDIGESLTPSTIVPGLEVTHVKTGRKYEVITAAYDASNATDRVVYRSKEDGTMWIRSMAEFTDGRFALSTMALRPQLQHITAQLSGVLERFPLKDWDQDDVQSQLTDILDALRNLDAIALDARDANGDDLSGSHKRRLVAAIHHVIGQLGEGIDVINIINPTDDDATRKRKVELQILHRAANIIAAT